MFTLLSEQQKKHLYSEYRLRLLSLIAFFFSALFLIAAALLLPSRIMLSIERGALESEKGMYETFATTQNSKVLLSTLGEIKSMVSLATPDETKLYLVLQDVLTLRPSNVSIRSITYTRGVGAPSSITLQGVAGERADLISFFRTLEKDPQFSDGDLPVGSLAKESNVSYTINLEGKF
ncbi:MAG: PilN domain-containing protein [Candidatus Paceibacterota bacterium]|jgi:hypothetical protein